MKFVLLVAICYSLVGCDSPKAPTGRQSSERNAPCYDSEKVNELEDLINQEGSAVTGAAISSTGNWAVAARHSTRAAGLLESEAGLWKEDARVSTAIYQNALQWEFMETT